MSSMISVVEKAIIIINHHIMIFYFSYLSFQSSFVTTSKSSNKSFNVFIARILPVKFVFNTRIGKISN